MESPQPLNEVPVGKNRTPWIIAIVLILLCCCCLVLVGVGYYSYLTIRSVETEILPFGDIDPLPSESPDAVIPDPEDGPGLPPQGGLGNDTLKYDTWQYVSASAVAQGCDRPVGADSMIEVLQEPDAGGVWVEKWTVACGSGDLYVFEVEYVLDDTGATFNIRSLP